MSGRDPAYRSKLEEVKRVIRAVEYMLWLEVNNLYQDQRLSARSGPPFFDFFFSSLCGLGGVFSIRLTVSSNSLLGLSEGMRSFIHNIVYLADHKTRKFIVPEGFVA